MSRRTFLQGAATLAAGATTALAAGPAMTLEARPAKFQLGPEDFPKTDVWGYDGSVPGPVIRAKQGGRIARQFLNKLPQASSVHWHGIRIDNAMDGVAGLTQEAVPVGGEFQYDFAVPDAGTYWYHPHNRSWEQMARGLYGALIVVEPSGAPDVDGEDILLIDDWRIGRDGQISNDFGHMGDWSHAGRIGNWVTVNGNGAWSRMVKRNSRHRLRLINTANARMFLLGAKGLDGWIIALDGMPLERPEPIGRFDLAPAQRADIVVDVTADIGAEAFLISHERDADYAIAAFKVEGEERSQRLAAPSALPPNPVPALGPLDSARSAELLMEGGAMGRMSGAMMGGRMMNMRDLVPAGKVWAFNGLAEMPKAPLVEAERGETVRIAIRNDTAWPHAMHLHGHHFRRIRPGKEPGPLRDTLLMRRNEVAEIAFVADNPGDWLLHCHMLEHSAGGMMTWLRVG